MKEHYVIRKVGDQFVTEIQPNRNTAMYAAAGGALMLLGLLKRGVSGAVLGSIGGAMVYYGVTGRNPIGRLISGCNKAPGDGRSEETPSFARDDKSNSAQLPADDIDEAAMESFPASDPPGRIRTSA